MVAVGTVGVVARGVVSGVVVGMEAKMEVSIELDPSKIVLVEESIVADCAVKG